MKAMMIPYGVELREAIRTGDRELMRAWVRVSHFLMERADGADPKAVADWKAAHGELERALGGKG